MDAILRYRTRIQAHPRYRWIVLATVLFGLFAVGFSFTILSTVLPQIDSEFGVNESVSHWVVTAPILVFGIAGPIVGKFGDIYGAKRPFLIGFGIATIFLLLTGFAWDIGSLILFRVVAALEGAATGPCAVKYIAAHFDPEERSKAFGWFSFVSAGAPTLGLFAGAAIVPVLGWRAIFFIQAPMCAVALLFAWVILDDTEARPDVRVHVPGAILLGAAAFCGLFALNLGVASGWTRTLYLMVAATPVLLVAFVWSQKRTDHPLFPLRYFRRRNFTLSLLSSTLVNFAYLGGFIIAPFLLADLLGLDQRQTLAVLVSRPLAFTVVAIGAGYAVARVGERVGAVFGAAAIATAMVMLAGVGESGPVVLVICGLATAGVGLGFCQPSLNTASVNAMDLEDQAVAGGMAASVQSIGAALGNVVLVGIVRSGLPPGTTTADAAPSVLRSAFGEAYLVGAIVALAAVLVSVGIRRTPRTVAEAEPHLPDVEVVETGELI